MMRRLRAVKTPASTLYSILLLTFRVPSRIHFLHPGLVVEEWAAEAFGAEELMSAAETEPFALDLATLGWRPLGSPKSGHWSTAKSIAPLFAYGGLKLVDGMLIVATGSARDNAQLIAPGQKSGCDHRHQHEQQQPLSLTHARSLSLSLSLSPLLL